MRRVVPSTTGAEARMMDKQGATAEGRWLAGFAAPWSGLRYMRRHPRLWRYAVLPVVLNLLITFAALVLLVLAAVFTFTQLRPWLAQRDYHVAWQVLAAALLLVVAAVLAVATWKLLEGILCGHYYGKLAREVELQLGIDPGEMRDIPFRYQVVDSFRDFAALLIGHAALLLLNCVPAIGSVAAVCGSFYFTCSILGRDWLDYPLALRGVGGAEKRAFFRKRRPETLGLGAAVLLFTFVPLLGAIAQTTATTGAVLLYRRLDVKPVPGEPVSEPIMGGKPREAAV